MREVTVPSPADPHLGGRLTRRLLAIAAAVHLVVAFALLHNVWMSPTTSVAGPAHIDAPGYGANGIANGDALQLVWFVKWTPYALIHLHDPLFTTYQNAPAGANLMWDALMPLAGVALAPVTLLAGPIVAFNLLATLATALCGLAATACARRFVRTSVSAVIAGLAFQLSPFVVAQSQGHQSVVLAAALVPCVVLLVADVVVYRTRTLVRGGLLLGLAGAVAFYTWEETLLSTTLTAAIGLVVLVLVAHRGFRSSWRRAVRLVAVAAAVALLLVIPGIAFQFLGPMHLSGVGIRDPNHWVIDGLNVLIPTSSQLLSPPIAVSTSHHWTGNSFEWGGYLGLPLLLTIVGVTVALWRRRDVRWLSAMTLIGVALSLGPSLHLGGHDMHIPLPWAPFTGIPLVRNVLPTRLAVFPAFLAALLLAVAVDALVSRRSYWPAAVVTVAVAATLMPAPLPTQPMSIPAFFTDGAVNRLAPESVVLVAPYATPLAPQPMLWQAASNMRFRMPEGYVSLTNPGGRLLESPSQTTTSTTLEAIAAGRHPVIDGRLSDLIRADLRRWTVRSVVVGPMANEQEAISLFSAVLHRSPAHVDGVFVWWQV